MNHRITFTTPHLASVGFEYRGHTGSITDRRDRSWFDSIFFGGYFVCFDGQVIKDHRYCRTVDGVKQHIIKTVDRHIADKNARDRARAEFAAEFGLEVSEE